MSYSDNFSSSVCTYHFSFKNRGEHLKTKGSLFLIVWFYLGPDNSAGRKISCWPVPYQITCHIFLSFPSFFSLHDSLSYLVFDTVVLTCLHVYRHSSAIWGNHIHDCACPYFPVSNTGNWDILFFKYYLFFAYNSYKSRKFFFRFTSFIPGMRIEINTLQFSLGPHFYQNSSFADCCGWKKNVGLELGVKFQDYFFVTVQILDIRIWHPIQQQCIDAFKSQGLLPSFHVFLLILKDPVFDVASPTET